MRGKKLKKKICYFTKFGYKNKRVAVEENTSWFDFAVAFKMKHECVCLWAEVTGCRRLETSKLTLTRGQARGVECREDIQHPGRKGISWPNSGRQGRQEDTYLDKERELKESSPDSWVFFCLVMQASDRGQGGAWRLQSGLQWSCCVSFSGKLGRREHRSGTWLALRDFHDGGRTGMWGVYRHWSGDWME